MKIAIEFAEDNDVKIPKTADELGQTFDNFGKDIRDGATCAFGVGAFGKRLHGKHLSLNIERCQNYGF